MKPKTRRDFLKQSAFVVGAIHAEAFGKSKELGLMAPSRPVELHAPNVEEGSDIRLSWVGEKPPSQAAGVSFGVPWPQGAVRSGSEFRLRIGAGDLPLQSWPLAYWPDGSLKWSGFATVVPASLNEAVILSRDSSSAQGMVSVKRNGAAVVVNTGAMSCSIASSGTSLFDSIVLGDKQIAGPAQLVCILQNGPQNLAEDSPARERFVSEIKRVKVEQSGPVRSVVKVDGIHRGERSRREWLPFTIRLYFYTGLSSLRLVHTIVFDGNQEKDFVRGLGLQVEVPMRDDPKNRTVRFAGENGGLWSEPLQPGGGNVAQESGQPFAGNAVFEKNAIWDDFKLAQPTPHGFTIAKRTNPNSTWLFSAAGKRSQGLASLSDLSGGLAVGIKNFWQSYPAGLEVQGASGGSPKLVAWLWSPDGPEMDMRFYDSHGHGLDAAYEDVQPGLSTAYGVARTSELTLYALDGWPQRNDSVIMAQEANQLPLLACSPEYIHSTGVFGVWSLPDRSTAFKKSIEDGLDSVLAYYQGQVDERSWYGFWQYGDFMHSYSAPRHQWHYDWGGHAWDDTELAVPLWLWESYLRTGRSDLFRFAADYTRNTSETDVYHLGPMRGLGSRHNVVKWGDGAKEVRISQAAHWRPFYYLTTDERTGDLMREAAEWAGVSIANFDPMREAAPATPGEPKVRIRVGPDWFAMAGNWMTEWERTNDVRRRDHILAGVDSILSMKFGLETGKPTEKATAEAAIVGYDNATGKLSPIPDMKTGQYGVANYNLATIQGGAQVMFELIPLLGREDFAKEWLRLCRLAVAPPEVWIRDKITNSEGSDAQYVAPGQGGARLAAWVYSKTGNKAFGQKALTMLLQLRGGFANVRNVAEPDTLNPVEEDPRMSTNEASQTSLSCIEVLELCRDILPTEAAVWHIREVRRRPAAPSR